MLGTFPCWSPEFRETVGVCEKWSSNRLILGSATLSISMTVAYAIYVSVECSLAHAGGLNRVLRRYLHAAVLIAAVR